jgi:hyperosmotically inducible protein
MAGQSQDRLASQVRHELAMLPYVTVFDNLTYRIDGSTVILGGQVSRPILKEDAERVVERIENVGEVVNEIEVLPTSISDDRIRVSVFRAIYSQPALAKYGRGVHPRIRILVKNGNVTLEGEVLNENDGHIAFIRANQVPGVFTVTNNLKVSSHDE